MGEMISINEVGLISILPVSSYIRENKPSNTKNKILFEQDKETKRFFDVLFEEQRGFKHKKYFELLIYNCIIPKLSIPSDITKKELNSLIFNIIKFISDDMKNIKGFSFHKIEKLNTKFIRKADPTVEDFTNFLEDQEYYLLITLDKIENIEENNEFQKNLSDNLLNKLFYYLEFTIKYLIRLIDNLFLTLDIKKELNDSDNILPEIANFNYILFQLGILIFQNIILEISKLTLKSKTKIENIKPIQDLSEQFNKILNFIKKTAGIELNKLIDEEINENNLNEEKETKKRKKYSKNYSLKKILRIFH